MIELVPYRSEMAPELLAIWRAAVGEGYPIMPDLFKANTEGDPNFTAEDLMVASEGHRLVGFLLTKRYRGDFPGCERYADVGYLALMAVHPEFQRQGIGGALLDRGEATLRAEGSRRLILGGSFFHFLPGLPSDAEAARVFLEKRGYEALKDVYDVRRSLDDGFVMPDIARALSATDVSVRPYRPGEERALLDFLVAEFPGRWAQDTAYFLEQGKPIGEVLGVFQGDHPKGFAHLNPPGSPGAKRWAGFKPNMAALGPIGVGEALKGRGLGLALLVKGIELLQASGTTEMVIDWTDLLDFYARVGFKPWMRYTLARKAVL